MAKTFTAPFAQTNKTSTVVCTLAGTTLDDTPTNTALLLTAGGEGSLLTKLTAMPRSTITATGIYLFLSKDNGTTKRLIDSSFMEAWTSDNTTINPHSTFANITESTAIRLEADDELYVSVGVATIEGIVFRAEMTDY